MVYFVSYHDDKNQEHFLRFWNDMGVWEWLQKWLAEKGSFPAQLCVYRGDCIFDGS